MYRFGQRLRHRYRLYLAMVAGVAVAIGGWLVLTRVALQPDTTLSPTAIVNHHYGVEGAATQRITRSPFVLDLPKDWLSVDTTGSPHKMYSWQGGLKEDSARRIDVYIDDLPTGLAVNRLLPVQENGTGVTITGTVSDNCTEFTDKGSEASDNSTAPAKWDGVNFICDVRNFERDVVAIGAPSIVNAVSLTGPTTGTHRVLVVYTDHTANPDYSIFTAAVQSFHLL